MGTLTRPTRLAPVLLLLLLLGVAAFAAACGGGSNETATTEAVGATGSTIAGVTGTTATGAQTETTQGAANVGATVRIGLIPWDEDIAATYLWKHILENQGYTVEITQLDVAPVYSGLAQGDLDLFMDAWLPITHADYWAQYGPKLEDLGIWYDNGLLTMAVPDYVDVTTIGDLKGKGSMFNNQIIGIEPGAGLMRVVRNDAMPGYGIQDEYTLVEGSTPAMLAELDRATKNNDPIVVTLWHPHWAYSAYPIKDLEDPKGLMGNAEEMHAVGRGGFQADFPQVSQWLSNFKIDDSQLASLEELVINKYSEGQEEQAVQEWLNTPANQDLVNSWIGQ